MPRSLIGEDQVRDADFVSPGEHSHELAHYFTSLVDVPTYSGSGGGYFRATASGAEWVPAVGPTTFAELYDVPNNYEPGKYLRSTISGIEWIDLLTTPEYTTFSGLIDTPNTYEVGRYLRSTTSGFEWTTASGIEGPEGPQGPAGVDGSDAPTTFSGLSDTPDIYYVGKYLRSTNSGIQWTDDVGPETFLELPDTPNNYEPNKHLHSTSSGVEWVGNVALTDTAQDITSGWTFKTASPEFQISPVFANDVIGQEEILVAVLKM